MPELSILRDCVKEWECLLLVRKHYCELISSAIVNSGFIAKPSSLHVMCMKTNLPNDILLKIIKEWKEKQKDPLFKGEVNFETNEEVVVFLKSLEPRFLPNPQQNWGPKAAAMIKTQRKTTTTTKEQDKETKTQDEELAKKIKKTKIE